MKKKTLFVVIAVTTLLMTGCRYSVVGYDNSGSNAYSIDHPINPDNEDFVYLNSSREVDGDIVTITFKYRIKEKER